MSGLRQQQKTDRNSRILDAASRLFKKYGYEKANMGDNAEIAEVSTGTVYNYYKSKGDLLMAIVTLSIYRQLSDGEKLIAKPPADADAAINQLLFAYLDKCLGSLNKDYVAKCNRPVHQPARITQRQALHPARYRFDQSGE